MIYRCSEITLTTILSISYFFQDFEMTLREIIFRCFLAVLLIASISSCVNTYQAKTLTPNLSFSVNADMQNLKLQQARFGHAAVNDGQFLYILGGTGNSLRGDIEVIDLQTGNTKVLADKIKPRRYFSAVHDGKESIYIFGGMSEQNNRLWFESSIEVFNTRTQNISNLKDFTLPTRINRAVLHNNTVYILGGDRPSDWGLMSTNRMFAFDLSTHQWRSLADMPTAKATSAVVYQDHIYVIGGFDAQNPMSVFERYDINNNTWETLPSLPVPTSANSSAVVGNKLFSFGDYQQLDRTLVYDFETQQWQQINIGYLPARHAAITTDNNAIYITGGTRKTRRGAIDVVQKLVIN